MEYTIAETYYDNKKVLCLSTISNTHTDYVGYCKLEQKYSEYIIIDSFKVLEKYKSKEDSAGNCYDFYIIEEYNRQFDYYSPAKEKLSANIDLNQKTTLELAEIISDLCGTIETLNTKIDLLESKVNNNEHG